MNVRLDDAIDLVAKQMTSLPGDDALAARIVGSLPERSTWSLQWFMPRLAVLAMLVVAGMMWSARNTTVVLTPLASSAKPLMTGLHVSIEAAPNRTMPLEPLERLEPLEPVVPRLDHEFSLPALAAIASLEDERLIVEPLAIADLPATNDFPR